MSSRFVYALRCDNFLFSDWMILHCVQALKVVLSLVEVCIVPPLSLWIMLLKHQWADMFSRPCFQFRFIEWLLSHSIVDFPSFSSPNLLFMVHWGEILVGYTLSVAISSHSIVHSYYEVVFICIIKFASWAYCFLFVFVKPATS